MNRLPIIIFVCIAFASIGHAREAARLAISADPSLAKEADLLTVQLSQSPGVVLLERQQILKIANEHSLKAGQTSDDMKLGQLLGADGLLILSKTKVGDHDLLAARLVAVHLGIVIDEWTSPPYEVAEGRAMPAFFSSRIVPLLPKLRLEKKDVIPVSVAGLFAAVDTPELRSIEKELTWLLIHRLTREPSLLVLERRKMEDLVLEKSLANEEKSPFLGGAVIVEGKLEEHDGKLDLALGLRRSGEKKATPVNIQSQKHDLKAFADSITASILGNLRLKPVEQNWNLEEEAAMYADQAEWALHHRMIDLCISSAESAWALGRRDVDLARLRVIAHSLVATPYWPDIMDDALYRGGSNVGDGSWNLPSEDQVRHLAATIRALEISDECLLADLPPSKISGRKFRPVAAQALLLASRLIKKHYLSGKYNQHTEQLNYLRSLAIQVCNKVYKTNGDLPPPLMEMQYWRNRDALECVATYAPYWYDTNEEIIEWMHRLLKSVPYGEDRDDALRTERLMEDEIFLKPRLVPWVVAWDSTKTKERQLDMLKRLKKLTESADFDDQLVGWTSLRWLVNQAKQATLTENDIRWSQDYAAALAGKPTKDSPYEIVSKGAQEFFWKEREIFATRHRTAAFEILHDVLSETDREYRLRYIRYIFEKEYYNHWVWLRPLLDKLDLTDEERLEFCQLCTTARDKMQKREDFRHKEHSLLNLDQALNILVKDHPQLKPKPAPKPQAKPNPKSTPTQPPTSPPLIVTRYWYPSASADAPKMRSGFRLNGASYADGKLWFVPDGISSVEYLGSVALDSFHAEYRVLPFPRMSPSRSSLLVTKDAVYLLNSKENKKWDRHNGNWSSLDLPGYPFNGRIIGDQLYLNYEFGSEYLGIDLKRSSSAGSGIVRLDPTNDSATFLASSRRRPAETILDAREPYVPQAVFSGAGGTVSAALEFPSSGDRKIFRTTAGGDWEEVMDLPNTEIGQVHFQYVNDGILAYMYPRGDPHTFFQIVFFDAGGGPAQVLLSRSKPSDPPNAILPGAPRWDMHAESLPFFYWSTAYDYYEGRLYQMRLLDRIYHEDFKESDVDVPTPALILSIYTPDSRAPLNIPLRFQLSEADKSQIIAKKYSISDSKLSARAHEALTIKNVERVSGMKVVPEGIVFFGGEGIGFWLLPAKELDERIEQFSKKQGE